MKLYLGTNMKIAYMARRLALVYTLFLFFLGGSPITAQTAKTKAVRWEKLEIRNDSIAFYNGVPFTGRADYFYPTETGKVPKLAKRAEFKNGIFHGEFAKLKPNGDFLLRETYKEGVKHGPFYYYYENGKVEVMGEFNHAQIDGLVQGFYASGKKYYINRYTQGERNGLCEAYFENGNMETESRYRNGIPVGEHLGYFDNGTLRFFKKFNDSGALHGPHYYYHATGCAAIEEYYKNGKLDSIQRAWDASSCALIRVGFWDEGKENGTFAEFNMFGDTINLTQYKNGLKHGVYGVYRIEKDAKTNVRFRDIETEGQYVEGYAEGYWVYGQKSCFQRREGKYEKGLKVGEWKYYDHKCELMLLQKYDADGNLLEEEVFE